MAQNDRCPYVRALSAGFSECGAYQPVQFVPLNTHFDVLAPVWSCSHLAVGIAGGAVHRHYPACRLGDASARAGWVRGLHADRLAALRALQTELAAASAELSAKLWVAKGAQLRARDTTERDATSAELRRLAATYMTSAETFFGERSAEFAAVGLPADAMVALIAEIIDGWIDQDHAEIPVISEATLATFPTSVHALLRPDLAVGAAESSARPTQDDVAAGTGNQLEAQPPGTGVPRRRRQA